MVAFSFLYGVFEIFVEAKNAGGASLSAVYVSVHCG